MKEREQKGRIEQLAQSLNISKERAGLLLNFWVFQAKCFCLQPKVYYSDLLNKKAKEGEAIRAFLQGGSKEEFLRVQRKNNDSLQRRKRTFYFRESADMAYIFASWTKNPKDYLKAQVHEEAHRGVIQSFDKGVKTMFSLFVCSDALVPRIEIVTKILPNGPSGYDPNEALRSNSLFGRWNEAKLRGFCLYLIANTHDKSEGDRLMLG